VSDRSTTEFSLVGFAVALVTVAVGTAAGLTAIPTVGSYLGMVLGGFVAGLAIDDRPVIEAGVAAVLANFGILMLGPFIGNGVVAAVTALGSVAPTTLLVSIVLSFALGAFGGHFGDDLRVGLTDSVEETPSRPRDAATYVPDPSLSDDESIDRELADQDSAEYEPIDREPADSATETADSSDDAELERN